MLYPQTSTEEWIQKHQLTPEVHTCYKCKERSKTSIPIIIKGYAGLETPIHDCGRQYTSAVFTPTSKLEIEFWSKSYA